MTRRSFTAIFSIAILLAPLTEDMTWAQSREGASRNRPSIPSRSGSAGRRSRFSRSGDDSRTSGPLSGRAPSGLSRSRTSAPGAAGAAAKEEAAEAEKEEAGASDSSGGFFRSLRRWVYARRFVVFGVLGALCIGGFVWLAIAGRRRSKRGESFLEALDDELAAGGGAPATPSGFSSTKIRARDVNARLGIGTVEGESIETDREYALVVDEEAIRRPPPGEVDGLTGKEYVEDSSIRECLDEKRFDDAWNEYRNRVDADGSAEFHSDLEHALSEHFLHQRDFEKAATVLEHHVATHARASVEPEVYFNLGYIHFLTKTYNKSRRFLRLFVQSEVEAGYKDRARKILRTLDRTGKSLN